MPNNTVTKAKPMKAKRVSEWDNPRCWLVPRSSHPPGPPKGFTWAGVVHRHCLDPDGPKVVVRPDCWGPVAVPLVRMVLILPAVSAVALLVGKDLEPWHSHLRTRRSCWWPFRAGATLELWAASGRQGEVLLVPLKEAEVTA